MTKQLRRRLAFLHEHYLQCTTAFVAHHQSEFADQCHQHLMAACDMLDDIANVGAVPLAQNALRSLRAFENFREIAQQAAQMLRTWRIGTCPSDMLTALIPREPLAEERVLVLTVMLAGGGMNARMFCSNFSNRLCPACPTLSAHPRRLIVGHRSFASAVAARMERAWLL
jgi:hypothetical protein